mgnify:CR=1 FL=1
MSSITSADMTLPVEATSTLRTSTSHEHVHQPVSILNADGTNTQTPQEPYGTNQVENDGCMDVDGKCHKEQ